MKKAKTWWEIPDEHLLCVQNSAKRFANIILFNPYIIFQLHTTKFQLWATCACRMDVCPGNVKCWNFHFVLAFYSWPQNSNSQISSVWRLWDYPQLQNIHMLLYIIYNDSCYCWQHLNTINKTHWIFIAFIHTISPSWFCFPTQSQNPGVDHVNVTHYSAEM